MDNAAARYVATKNSKGRLLKTQDRYADEMKHIVAFFGGETLMSAIRYDECCDRRRQDACMATLFP
jgi:hypothetical protein